MRSLNNLNALAIDSVDYNVVRFIQISIRDSFLTFTTVNFHYATIEKLHLIKHGESFDSYCAYPITKAIPIPDEHR